MNRKGLKMYVVSVFEKVNGQLALSQYSFENEGEMNKFVEICREDNAIVIVRSANNKSA